MIYDVLEIFKQEYEKKGDKLILDNYKLKEGLYVRVTKDGTFEKYFSKKVKKDLIFCDENNELQPKKEDWFKRVDYVSGYLNSNKSFSDKKIHNINYLSFFIKVDNRPTDDAIKKHYKGLCDYKKFTKKEEREILKKYDNYLQSRFRRKNIINAYRTIQLNLDSLIEFALQNDVKNYIKIFFDEEFELYENESKIYYDIKIFNDIKYSKKIDKSIYGLSDSNMGLNSKKPFLEHKNRRLSVPFMLLNEDALMIKKFFDFLKFRDFQNRFPLSENIFLNRNFKEKDLVMEYDFIPFVEKKLSKLFEYKNFLKIKKDKRVLDDVSYEYVNQIEDIVDDVFYNKQLKFNYFNDDIKVSKFLSKELQNMLFVTKGAMINYFKKNRDVEFYSVLKKYGVRFVLEHIVTERFYKAKEALNLLFSFKEYKGESVMDIQKLQKSIIERLDNSDYEKLESEEFFYLAGQVASFLISQSEAGDKKADLYEPYLRASSVKKLKKDIEFTFFKYKHKVSLNHKRFKNAMSQLMAYEGDEKPVKYMESLLVGLMSENIFYMKKEERDDA